MTLFPSDDSVLEFVTKCLYFSPFSLNEKITIVIIMVSSICVYWYANKFYIHPHEHEENYFNFFSDQKC